jgi:hypothetical protein
MSKNIIFVLYIPSLSAQIRRVQINIVDTFISETYTRNQASLPHISW